jgi:2-oxoglutarate ferredoxin oxidoreductase subunit gamma
MANPTMSEGDRYEVRLSGSGGQGLILAAVILAAAVVEEENRNAVQIQSYGPEARGGATKADVVIADGEIFYPKARELDLLLALTQEAFDKYHRDVKKEGLIIVDEDAVPRFHAPVDVIVLPIIRTAREKIQAAVTANIISLGVIQELTKVVKVKSLQEAIKNRVPPHFVDKNMLAFDTGRQMMRSYLKENPL